MLLCSALDQDKIEKLFDDCFYHRKAEHGLPNDKAHEVAKMLRYQSASSHTHTGHKRSRTQPQPTATPTLPHLPTLYPHPHRCETNEEVTELYECIVSLLWQVRVGMRQGTAQQPSHLTTSPLSSPCCGS